MTAPTQGRACDAYWPLINDEIDGLLEPAERAVLEQHLAGCAGCRSAAADLAQITRTAKAWPARRPRADAWQQIAGRISREHPGADTNRAAFWR